MTPRRWCVALVVVLLAPFTSQIHATADAGICDAYTSPDGLTVYCERAGSAAGGHVTRARTPLTRRQLIPGFDRVSAPICFLNSVQGLLFISQRTTLAGRLLSSINVCIPDGPPPPSQRVPDRAFSEQVTQSRQWPPGDLAINPSARFLVAYPYALSHTGDIALQVDATLTDGSRARGTATIVALSWFVDGAFVTSSRPGVSGDPKLGYVWSNSGRHTVDVVASWSALLDVTYASGSIEQRELEPIDAIVGRDLTVEQVQAVIDYEH